MIRGRVLTDAGAPLTSAEIVVLDHPEFGFTQAQTNGEFSLVVNGGGELVFEISAPGFLQAQRRIVVPWAESKTLPDVALVRLDSHSTDIDLGSSATSFQVAQSSPVSDSDGTRSATLLFPPETTATMVFADGSTQPLSAMTVRATEYTSGPLGPQKMPGDLPPGVLYTYAVELSVDEAMQAGAVDVVLNQPVYVCVDNFLNFPVGSLVPNDRRHDSFEFRQR